MLRLRPWRCAIHYLNRTRSLARLFELRSSPAALVALLVGTGVQCSSGPSNSAAHSTRHSPHGVDTAVDTPRDASPVTVVLFQSPKECLTCSTDTYEWIELAREVGGALAIVLSAIPTEEEAAALRRMRLKYTVLHPPRRFGNAASPPALAVLRGTDTLIMEEELTATRRVQLRDSVRRVALRK